MTTTIDPQEQAKREVALDQLLTERFNYGLCKTVGDRPVYRIVTAANLTGPRSRSAADVFTLKTTDVFTVKEAEKWAADEVGRWAAEGA